jgi:hypothetical protein
MGVGTLGLRMLAALLAVLVILAVNSVLVKLKASFEARLLALSVLIPFGVAYWPIPSHHWWVDLLEICAVLALLQVESSSRGWKWTFLAGILAALALFTLQDQGLYFAVGATCILALTAPKEKRWGELAPWLLGIVAGALPFILWLLPTAGWRALFNAWVLFPLTRYHDLPGHGWDLMAGFREIVSLCTSGAVWRAPFYVASLTLSGLFLLLLPLVATFSFVIAYSRREIPRSTLGLLLTLLLAAAATALHRWSFTNAIWAAPCLLTALCCILPRRLNGHSANFLRYGMVGVAGVFLLNSMIFYRLSTVAIPVSGPGGKLYSLVKPEAPDLQAVLTFLARNSKPGDALFCPGFISGINILALMPNPTRYDQMIPPRYNSVEEATEASEALEKFQVRWVLTRDSNGQHADDDPVRSLLSYKYRPVLRNSTFILWERKVLG